MDLEEQKRQEYEKQKRLVLQSFDLKEHPSKPLTDVFNVASGEIRTGCMRGKVLLQVKDGREKAAIERRRAPTRRPFSFREPFFFPSLSHFRPLSVLSRQAVIDVGRVLHDQFRDHAMTERRAESIAQALLMKAVYDGTASLYRPKDEEISGETAGEVWIQTHSETSDHLDLAHDPGSPQDRDKRHFDGNDCADLVACLPQAMFTFAGGRAPFREVRESDEGESGDGAAPPSPRTRTALFFCFDPLLPLLPPSFGRREMHCPPRAPFEPKTHSRHGNKKKKHNIKTTKGRLPRAPCCFWFRPREAAAAGGGEEKEEEAEEAGGGGAEAATPPTVSGKTNINAGD